MKRKLLVAALVCVVLCGCSTRLGVDVKSCLLVEYALPSMFALLTEDGARLTTESNQPLRTE